MKTIEELHNYHPQATGAIQRAVRRKRRARWFNEHWLGILLTLFLLFNLGPWFAPVFMKFGWTTPATVTYTLYSPLCHQMAQRSFFLFGEDVMYAPEALPFALSGNTGEDTRRLRQFRGNEELGWKIAWSDRMISMYGGLWFAMLLIATLSRFRRIRPLPLWVFVLTLLPMLLDGGTHMISDFDGLQAGFRYDNAWLASLTGHALPDGFYLGDDLGSFNSWMRLLSGVVFGFGVIWFVFPYLLQAVEQASLTLRDQLYRAAELYDLTGEQ
jgi:uncharacterized membrane protein